MASDSGTKPWGKLALFGVASAVCYGWLFAHLNDREAMALFTRKEGIYPLLPVAAAFVFSLFHGNFTSYFWDVVGIRAKAHKPQPVVEELVDEAEGSED